MDLSYLINHYGEERDQYFNSVAPPIIQASNFVFDSVEAMRASLADEMDVPFYTRGHNPTVAILRKKLAALEGAEECLVFSSGIAAISAAIMSSVQAGDHIVSVQKPYSWTARLLEDYLPKFGVQATMIDGTDPENFRKAIQPNTRLFVFESPNSITFEMQDIPAVVAIAREHQITTVIDNSYASPINQNPIEMGVDIVMHSASKYLGGHSDLVAGVLCSSRERCEKIFDTQFMNLGGIIGPQDAWLMLRGLRTLPLRMERIAQTAPKVVEFLENHPLVEKVYYPFSPSNPQYELAKKQMKKPAGQFSVLLKADKIEQVDRFCDGLKYFLLACSWGGYESLIFPSSVLYSAKAYTKPPDLPWNLIRFYVGLEDPEVLIQDLEQALELMEGEKKLVK